MSKRSSNTSSNASSSAASIANANVAANAAAGNANANPNPNNNAANAANAIANANAAANAAANANANANAAAVAANADANYQDDQGDHTLAMLALMQQKIHQLEARGAELEAQQQHQHRVNLIKAVVKPKSPVYLKSVLCTKVSQTCAAYLATGQIDLALFNAVLNEIEKYYYAQDASKDYKTEWGRLKKRVKALPWPKDCPVVDDIISILEQGDAELYPRDEHKTLADFLRALPGTLRHDTSPGRSSSGHNSLSSPASSFGFAKKRAAGPAEVSHDGEPCRYCSRAGSPQPDECYALLKKFKKDH
jgi:hypothetical protein